MKRVGLVVAVGGCLMAIGSIQTWATFSSVGSLQVIAEIRGNAFILGNVTLACGLVGMLIGFRAAWSDHERWMPVAAVVSAIALASVGLAAAMFALRPGGAFGEYGGLYPLELGFWAVVIGAVIAGIASLWSWRQRRDADLGGGATTGVLVVTPAHRGLAMAVVATLLGAAYAVIAVAWVTLFMAATVSGFVIPWHLVVLLLMLGGVYATAGYALSRRWRFGFMAAVALHALVLAESTRLIRVGPILRFEVTQLLHP